MGTVVGGVLVICVVGLEARYDDDDGVGEEEKMVKVVEVVEEEEALPVTLIYCDANR